MEKKDQLKNGLELIDTFAMNVFIFFTKGKKVAAKASYHQLLGAATMYGVFTDDDPHPIERYAVPKVRAACKFVGIDEEAVWHCIFD